MADLTKVKDFTKTFIPKPDRFQIIAVVFFTLLNMVFLAVAAWKNEFSLFDADIFFQFAFKLLFDASFLLFSILILKAIFRTAVVPALFTVLYAAIAIADTILYYFGNTLIERSHFVLITPYSITSFVPWYGIIVFAAALSAVMFFSYKGIKKIPILYIFRHALFWLIICILLNLLVVSGIFTREKNEKFDKVITEFRNAQIYYICQNQFIGFTTDVLFPSLGSQIGMFSPGTEDFVDDYDLFSDRFKLSDDIQAHKNIIEKTGIGIGKESPALQDSGYTRIIYIFAESLSLEALPCHNSKLESKFAGHFFCSDEMKSRTFTNITTSGSPTLQGLTVIFSSHPNYNIQEITGEINSMPKLLEKQGFKSVFIRSASKFFANENLVFKNMGFSEIIGREDFFENEELRRYIYGWGLEDRILYDQVVDYIKENKDQKLFVSILGTDTHPPYGQRRYKDLEYPETPRISVMDKGVKTWLTAIDRMDFDISSFIKRLDREGLFDESTLIIVSADHSCPLNNVSAKIPGHQKNNLAKMPLIFLSKRRLPEADYGTKSSQIDIAPTIFHLAGIPKPSGWWGTSLFDPSRKGYSLGFDKNFIYFSGNSASMTINADKPADESESAFIDLFDTVFQEK